jgi:predicted membrane metal-binding protein
LALIQQTSKHSTPTWGLLIIAQENRIIIGRWSQKQRLNQTNLHLNSPSRRAIKCKMVGTCSVRINRLRENNCVWVRGPPTTIF